MDMKDPLRLAREAGITPRLACPVCFGEVGIHPEKERCLLCIECGHEVELRVDHGEHEVEKVYITWRRFERQVDNLVERLGGEHFDRIVGISRGGLPLAVCLSHKLNIPLTVVGVSSYNDETHEQETLVCDTPDIIFQGWKGKILICDDIADSGLTLDFLLSRIKGNKSIECSTMTIFYKERSMIEPDYYAETTDKWIVFPWET